MSPDSFNISKPKTSNNRGSSVDTGSILNPLNLFRAAGEVGKEVGSRISGNNDYDIRNPYSSNYSAPSVHTGTSNNYVAPNTDSGNNQNGGKALGWDDLSNGSGGTNYGSAEQFNFYLNRVCL